MDVKISVIIPIYNMEEYLQECLDTVLSQTLKEIEIICVNDGSQDSSEQIIKDNMARDSRIKLISQENKGVATARNVAIDSAVGEFIIFMDPDDWYPDNDVLECLYNNAKENNVLICGGSFSELNEKELVTQFTGVRKKYTFDEDGIVYYKDYQFDYGYHRFIYNLEFIKANDLHFPFYIRYQDPPFFVRAMICAEKFYAMKKITYRYRVGHQNVNWTERKLMDLLKGLRDNIKLSGEAGLAELHKTTLERLGKNYIDWYAGMLENVSPEFMRVIFDIDASINRELLTDDARALKYANVTCDIIQRAISLGKHESKEKVLELKDEISKLKKKAEIYSDEIKVSVVIPIYDVEKYIDECLRSVLDQTLREIEIICVNDSTPDNSMEIVKKYAEHDKRIVIVNKENGGLSSARNAGLDVARGEYIYFLDSDDYLKRDALDTLYEQAHMWELDNIYFDAESFWESKELKDKMNNYDDYYKRKYSYSRVVSGPEMFRDMEMNNEYRSSAVMQMLKREFLLETGIRFYEGIIHEDELFTTQCMLRAKRVKHIPEAFYMRRVRENSIMEASKEYRSSWGYFICIREEVKTIFEQDYPEDVKAMIINRLLRVQNNVVGKIKNASDEELNEMLLNVATKDEVEYYLITRNLVKEHKKYEKIYKELRRLKTKIQKEPLKAAKLAKEKNAVDRLNVKLQKEIAKLKNDNKKLKRQINGVKNSNSYKIGHIIMYIPGKIKRLLRAKKKY